MLVTNCPLLLLQIWQIWHHTFYNELRILRTLYHQTVSALRRISWLWRDVKVRFRTTTLGLMQHLNLNPKTSATGRHDHHIKSILELLILICFLIATEVNNPVLLQCK